MNDSLSPEEKLLRLIKGEKKQEAAPEPAPQGIIAEEKIVAEAGGSKTLSESPAASVSKARPKPLDIHKLLIVFAGVSIIFSATAFIYPMLNLSKVKLPVVIKEEQPITTAEVKPKVRPWESYLAGLKSKQIFAAANAIDTSSSPVSVGNALDLIKDINLVGIISSEPPQAVIEDKKTQKTYYLSKGQSIGELKVENIQEGKVVLDYLGTKYELYM